jgi:Zn-dependent M28 family amino/carboxypeptidase
VPFRRVAGINDNGSGFASLVDSAEQIGSGATGAALVWEYAARRR